MVSEPRVEASLKLAYAGALSAHFLLMSLFLSLSFCFVFWLALPGFSALTEHLSPGSLKTPLSAAGPMLEAALATVILHVAVLAFLASRRLFFARFFLILLSVGTVSLLATYSIGLAAVLDFGGWYPSGSTPKPEYPILVITPGEQTGSFRAHVIPWSELPKFRSENPQYSSGSGWAGSSPTGSVAAPRSRLGDSTPTRG